MMRIPKVPIRLTRGLDICIALLLTIAGIQKCYRENIIGLLAADNTVVSAQTPKEQPANANANVNASILETDTTTSIKAEKEVVNQLRRDTNWNRYPDQYQRAVELTAGRDEGTFKILSFGSSTGLEAKSLGTLYFPQAKIYGVDVDDPTLEQARREVADAERYVFFNGLHQPIATHGPYDVIFANSVLCQHPVAVPGCAVYAAGPRHEAKMDCSLENFDQVYPFATFEETLQRLDAALKEGGILGIINSSYDFTASKVADNYEVTENALCQNNAVPRVNHVTRQFEYHDKRPCLYRKKKSKGSS